MPSDCPHSLRFDSPTTTLPGEAAKRGRCGRLDAWDVARRQSSQRSNPCRRRDKSHGLRGLSISQHQLEESPCLQGQLRGTCSGMSVRLDFVVTGAWHTRPNSDSRATMLMADTLKHRHAVIFFDSLRHDKDIER
jgi:hypothetical protein